ncbi:adenosine kinase-like [Anthonomus grandis grandis]|uniref:adenosine kinase-like n=1 Tax=Anthonomus grandis grandis TaxID=2921223 RepID=UPI002166ACC4|nr:adenosine kinase-like [Anthonomus grandis grandis]XP_050294412.1 adenosine kinase-like [Anthonomus grandis grandis]XP_050294413.1 adenosine kinase-like [Anthonomus grandis grandis]
MADFKTVLAFGNPLLDVTVTCTKESVNLIRKYNLKEDGQAEISRDKMRLLTEDIDGLEQYKSAGGCSQNSLRVLRWTLRGKCRAEVFGSVGNDTEAKILTTILKSDGVEPRYLIQEELPTGKSIALINGLKRCLVAHIGAAEVLPLKSLLSYKDFPNIFNKSDIILIEAYFLTNRFSTAKHIVDMCKQTDKSLVFNLCGEYIFKIVPEPIKYLVKRADIIFGNKAEFDALASLLSKDSIEDLAMDLTREGSKTLVITDGPNPVQCFTQTDNFYVKVPPLSSTEIKDTTGAGDAFVGGFLAGITLSRKLKSCIDIGIYAASNIIKQTGCTLPKYESGILLH